MRISPRLIGLALAPFLGGCQSHPFTDYRPMTAAGFYSGTIEDLKKLNATDLELPELIRLKKTGVSEETIVALVRIAHDHQHSFSATDSVSNLAGANFSEARILQIAQTDKLDSIGGDAVMLHVVGLSDSAVQWLLDRRLKGVPTMSVNTIAALKNTGLSEKDIVYRIQNGMTDAQGQAEAAGRQKSMAHSHTGFTSIRGRKAR